MSDGPKGGKGTAVRRPERVTAALLFVVLLVSLFALVRPQGNATAAATAVTPTISYGCGNGGTVPPFVAVTVDSQSATPVAVTAGLVTAAQASAAPLAFPTVYSDASSHRPLIVNAPASPGTVTVRLVGPVTSTDQVLVQTPGDEPVAYPLPANPSDPGGGPACDPTETADDYGLGTPATVSPPAVTCAMDGAGTATIATSVRNSNPADSSAMVAFAQASGEVAPSIDYTALLVNVTDPANPVQSGADSASFPDTVPDGIRDTSVPAGFTVSGHTPGSYEIELVGMDGSEIVATSAPLSVDCSADVPPPPQASPSDSSTPTATPTDTALSSLPASPSDTPTDSDTSTPTRSSQPILPPPASLITVDPSTSDIFAVSSPASSAVSPSQPPVTSSSQSPLNVVRTSPTLLVDPGSQPSSFTPHAERSTASAAASGVTSPGVIDSGSQPFPGSSPFPSSLAPVQSAVVVQGPTSASKPVIIIRRSSARLPALADPPSITPLRILAWHRDAAIVVAIDGLAVCSLVGATVWSARRR